MAQPNRDFDTRTAVGWLGLIVLTLALVALLWFGGRVLLLVFAGVLMAVVLRAPVSAIASRTPIPERLAYLLVVLGIVAVLVGFALLAGPQVLVQAGEFVDQVPSFIEDARNFLEDRPWGSWLVDRIEDGGDGQGQGDTAAQVASSLTDALRSVSVTLSHLVFVIVMALFLALTPRLYQTGLVRLFPARRQQRAAEVVNELGRTLKFWLVGQLSLMLITGVLTFIGLLILGIPLALALAFFVGLMEFIPLIGPILGFIPIVIMAATEGLTALLSVTILYLVIQQIEGNILTPLIQQRAVSLPPALTVGAVFLGGALFGPLGVILGTPLMAVIFVLVKMLYVHDVLGQTVEVPGKREPAE